MESDATWAIGVMVPAPFDLAGDWKWDELVDRAQRVQRARVTYEREQLRQHIDQAPAVVANS